jgi:predicted nucleic acid-binding Zn ribbon protein
VSIVSKFTTMKTKECKCCGSTFEGRSNKKFCSTNCKNDFHNENYRNQNFILYKLDKILHKNRAVLLDMYTIYRSSPINLDILKARGFHPNYHTHIFNSPLGEKYTMIYDVGFKNYFDNQIQIVQLDNVA